MLRIAMLDYQSLSKAFSVFCFFCLTFAKLSGPDNAPDNSYFFLDHGIVGRELSLACSKNVMTKMIVLR